MEDRAAVADRSTASEADLLRLTTARRGLNQRLISRFLHNRIALVGLFIVTIMVALAAFGPVLAPHPPDQQFGEHRLESPSKDFLLGTDNLGRDMLSRLLHAARLSIGMAALATVVIVAIAISVGSLAGYVGGLVDDLAMRIVDVLLAFPGLILALAIIGILGPSMLNVIISLAISTWASCARLVRGLVLEVRERPFVEAALAIGASGPRIVIRHILPNVISPVIVLVSLEMGTLILAIAGLNFLGLGVQPPTAEWGAMLNQGRPFFQSEPQLMIYPGIMISVTVLGFNLLGDGLRDVFDPRFTT
uniref:Putative binding-protein-dependent transport system inner membrane component n=1 Tax=uncultured marine microorganism HF4000_APKG10K24 TaxID=455562 RepID=B3TCI3_9ZZZZ|nr:putative binding-protein-dependent transport system inner membrane component [uncultured marine microorganism HF4000_APKG10K24]